MIRFRRWIKDFNFFDREKLRLIAWVGMTFLFFGLFLKITWELHEDSALVSFDQRILILISKFRVSALNGVAVDVTALGSPTVITLMTLLGVVVLYLGNDKRSAAYLGLGSAVAGIATFAMKHLFTRARPTVVPRLVEVSGFSYPSGHSISATSLYLLLMFLSWRYFSNWKSRVIMSACAVILISGVCFSRLYLGVHYPSDVVSGASLGAAWVFLLTAYFFRRSGEQREENDQP